ncbi:MAG TPA: sigma-70 family RNA polymerase sigma factor [Myxococcales bacterium]
MQGVEDDVELIRSVAHRDREAFERLYYRFAPRLGRYAFGMLRRREAVDEVMNDVMLAVWQEAPRFDERVGTVSAWLFGITHKKVIKMLERTARSARELPPEEVAPEPGEHPERAAIGRELGAAMADALAKLSADQRAVIELAFGQGQSYQAIALALDCPVNTVKTRMFHARKRLAEILDERGHP